MKFDRKRFFDGFKARIDSTMEQEQVDGLNFLLDNIERDEHWKDVRHIAYALATAGHETNWSFQPVEEGYYLKAQHGKAFMVKFQKSLRYYPYFGRGYVQLTWETLRIKNYSKATKKISEQLPELVTKFESETEKTFDLVKNPEQALHPLIAYAVLTLGMFQGWFTGKKLTDYINDTERDYVNSRRIINGTDKAGPIARHAERFFDILWAARIQDSASAPSEPSGGEIVTPEPSTQGSPAGAEQSEGTAGKEEPPAPPTVEVKAAKMTWDQILASVGAFLTSAGISLTNGLSNPWTLVVIGIFAVIGYLIYQHAQKQKQERTQMYFANAQNPETPSISVT